jgi:predicted alpha/beta-hydrolase family hydrolase
LCLSQFADRGAEVVLDARESIGEVLDLGVRMSRFTYPYAAARSTGMSSPPSRISVQDGEAAVVPAQVFFPRRDDALSNTAG